MCCSDDYKDGTEYQDIWLIYHSKDVSKNKWFIDSLINKGLDYGFKIKLIYAEDIIGQKVVQNHPLYAIARMINPELTIQLENMGIRVFNNSCISKLANNKAAAIEFASSIGIEHIPTIVVNGNGLLFDRIITDKFDDKSLNIYNKSISDFWEKGFESLFDLDYNCSVAKNKVIKSVSGHGGNEVYHLGEIDIYNDVLNMMEKYAARYFDDKYVVQPLIDCKGQDLRVYVIGDEIIGAVKRISKDGFKSNYSLGGKVTWYELNDRQKKVVNKIIMALKADYIGIDFLVYGDTDELIFNEIEDVVGARMLSECSDVGYIDKYLSHIAKEIQ